MAHPPVLEIEAARPETTEGHAPEPAFTLRLDRGDFALVEARDPIRAASFADLCCGLTALAAGRVRFMGRDWAAMPDEHAAALRGRIGRVFGLMGRDSFLDAQTATLWPQLHHTMREEAGLREEAAALSCRFGLPGLPLGRPADMPSNDLQRAACVRAFLCDPLLVILESPARAARHIDLVAPLVAAIEQTRRRGGAALWLTRSDYVWNDRSIPASARLRLLDRGLCAAGRAA